MTTQKSKGSRWYRLVTAEVSLPHSSHSWDFIRVKIPLCLLCRALSGDIAFLLHRIFMRSISVLGSDKQIAKWIPLATRYQLIGSYAQTELGHGKAAKKTQHFHRTEGAGPDSQGNLSSSCPCFTGAGVAEGGKCHLR